MALPNCCRFEPSIGPENRTGRIRTSSDLLSPLTSCQFRAHAQSGDNTTDILTVVISLSSWPKVTTFRKRCRTPLTFFPIFPGIKSLSSLKLPQPRIFRGIGVERQGTKANGLTRLRHILQLDRSAKLVISKDFVDFNSGGTERLVWLRNRGEG